MWKTLLFTQKYSDKFEAVVLGMCDPMPVAQNLNTTPLKSNHSENASLAKQYIHLKAQVSLNLSAKQGVAASHS